MVADGEQKSRVEEAPFEKTSPGTVVVTLTETRDGNKFLTDLGSYITSNKAAIGQPFFNELDPTTREAADSAAADTKNTLKIAAIEAVAAHKAADAKTGDDRSEAVIRVTQIKAQQACRKLRENGQYEADCIGY